MLVKGHLVPTLVPAVKAPLKHTVSVSIGIINELYLCSKSFIDNKKIVPAAIGIMVFESCTSHRGLGLRNICR